MGSWLSFKHLKPGDRFKFVYGVAATPAPRLGDTLYEKGRGGWYRVVLGGRVGQKAYRTGSLTAVRLDG